MKFEVSSGNIFSDIGTENTEEELTKAELDWEIEKIIKRKKVSSILGISNSKISSIINRKLVGISLDDLMHIFNVLNLHD